MKGSRKDLADRLGMSVQAVSKAIETGRIPAALVVRRGRGVEIDLEKAERAYAATTQVRIDHEEEEEDDGELPDGLASYKVSRARREAANADRAELERDKLRASLVSADDMRSESAEFRVVARSKFLSSTPRYRRICPEAGIDRRCSCGEIIPAADPGFRKHAQLDRQLASELAKEEEELGDSP